MSFMVSYGEFMVSFKRVTTVKCVSEVLLRLTTESPKIFGKY